MNRQGDNQLVRLSKRRFAVRLQSGDVLLDEIEGVVKVIDQLWCLLTFVVAHAYQTFFDSLTNLFQRLDVGGSRRAFQAVHVEEHLIDRFVCHVGAVRLLEIEQALN